MKYSKQRIREIRRGIEVGEYITDEQEELLHHFGIPIPDLPSDKRVMIVQNKLDGILRRKKRS